MKVLVTGGAGFLGGRIVRALLAHGHDVVLVVRGGRRAGLPEEASIVDGDIRDADLFLKAAEGCGAIIHTAAMVKIWSPRLQDFDDINIGGLRNAIAAARARGIRLVYTSSFFAVGPTGVSPADESQTHPGDYGNDYERTKALADEVARGYAREGGDIVILYPGVVYGPGELTDGNLVAKLLADQMNGVLPGIVGPGDRLWSYAFVDDVAEAHVAALEKAAKGERYLLAGANATLNEVFAIASKRAGRNLSPRRLPFGLARLVGRAMWTWADITGKMPDLTHQAVGIFEKNWAYRSDKAVRDLGYQVRPLEEGIRTTVDWLLEEGHAQ
ncbi:MAG: NAD-dependent epimerase/dehydratase family protein [Vicinamibacteria bacterium]|nr:NAD-dependent epimerase/dehydratase family protein [Vicinamibacteria bacterium]